MGQLHIHMQKNEFVILSEVSQRKTNIIWYHLYVESKKSDTNELIYKIEIDSQT